MKIKVITLILTVCLILTGCIRVEISVLGGDDVKTDTTQDTEEIETIIYDYPDAIGNDSEKLLTPLLPDEVFGSTAADNGLSGTVYQIYGTVEKISTGLDGIADTIHLHTHKGDVVISNPALSMEDDSSFSELGTVNWNMIESRCTMPEVGEFCRIFAEYQGYSEKYEAPYFIYGSTDFLAELLVDATMIE